MFTDNLLDYFLQTGSDSTVESRPLFLHGNSTSEVLEIPLCSSSVLSVRRYFSNPKMSSDVCVTWSIQVSGFPPPPLSLVDTVRLHETKYEIIPLIRSTLLLVCNKVVEVIRKDLYLARLRKLPDEYGPVRIDVKHF